MIAPRVDQHVITLRHVAADTLRGLAARLVMMMFGRVVVGLVQAGKLLVSRRVVALRAHGIAFGHQPAAVRLVAVGAGNTPGLHLGLQEGAEDEHFVLLLPIREVEVRRQQRQVIVVVERCSGIGLDLREGLAARMARAADIEFLRLVPGAERQRLVGVLARLRRRPGIVRRTRAMAGLAAHRQFGPVALVGARGKVIALVEACLVAGGAARLPVLVAAGPVQPVAWRRVLLGIEVEPLLLCHVPGEVEHLQPALLRLDQILLQRLVAHRVEHLEALRLAVSPLGLDEILAVLRGEARGDVLVGDRGVVEVTEHARCIRRLQGPGMVGAGPGGCLCGMAFRAAGAAREARMRGILGHREGGAHRA